MVLLVRSIYRGGHRLGIGSGSVWAFLKSESPRRILLTVVLSVVYGLVLLGRIPFILATGSYVLCFVLAFEYRLREPVKTQWKTLLFALAMAVAVTGVVAAVFRYLFLVTLP